MILSKSVFKFFALFIIILTSQIIYAQNGQIIGKILDKTNNEPLFGANVILVGTSFGASSDINGEFRVINIPIGEYTLKASYISYNINQINIEVTENKALSLSITLESQVIDLGQEVTVSAQSSGQASAINQQLASEAIVNVVSAEKMLEFPDANVAESVARLPGVSIIRDGGEGSGVVVRGLSPKFSKITVDGIDMASSGSTSRGANLSGVSQENLGGIELYKSPTADMDGEAIGGTINLLTSKAPEKSSAIFRSFGFYNELEKSLGQYSLFGKYNQRFSDNNFGVQASVNLESRDRSVDNFSGGYILGATNSEGIAPLNISSSAVSDIIETRGRVGGNLILDYNVGNGFLMFSSFLSNTTRDVLERSRSLSIANVSGDLRIRETERSLQSYVNTLRGEHQFFTMETDWSLSFSYSRNERPFDHWIRFNERIQLPNINDVPLNQNAVDYYNKVGVVNNSLIDETRFMQEDVQERNFTGQLNFKYHFNFSSDVSGYVKFGGKHKHINRNRNYEEAQLWAYLYPEWNTLSALSFLDSDYQPENFLRGKADLGIILDAERNRSFYDKYSSSDQYIKSTFYAYRSSVGVSSGIPNYQVKENVSAFYVMPKFNFGTLITIIPGVRYEIVNNEYFGNNYFSLVSNSPQPRSTDYFLNDTTSAVKYNDLLPMLHLKLQPTEWFDVRTSYTHTLSRPDYNWLVPSQSLSNFTGVNIYKGNPELKPARAYSYDIYTSLYEPKLGLFSIGYFYKTIDDISVLFRTFVGADQIKNGLPDFGIDPLQNNQHGIKGLYNGNYLRTPINLPESSVKGIELELQTNFQLLPVPSFLKGIVVSFNYSWIQSSTFFPWSKTTTKIVVDPVPRVVTLTEAGLREGKVPGQADNLMNISLGYDYKGFSARLSMFAQSESIEEVGTQKELDSYRDGYTRWDLSLKQRVLEFMEIFVNAVNINKKTDESFQSTSTFNTSIEDFGRSFELGVQLRL